MARRPVSLWSRSLQRSAARLAGSALRAGIKAFADAAQPAAAKKGRPKAKKRPLATPARAAARKPPAAPGKPVAPTGTGWTHGVATLGSASRRYLLFRPAGAAPDERLPLVVLLHGCQQDAAALIASSRMDRLASRERFLLLCPEQDRFAHGQGCWNWYETRNGRAQAEAALIVAAVDEAVSRHSADAGRVMIAGLSAGGGMAALAALHHPERFRAVAMHSGVAPGAAHSTATALMAMQGRRAPSLTRPGSLGPLGPLSPLGALGPLGPPGQPTPLPPLLVIHGSADTIVAPSNGGAAAHAWAEAMGAKAMPSRILRRGRRRPMQVTDFVLGRRIVVSLCSVEGLGHAWSGGAARQPWSDAAGPDAARLIWAFAIRQFRP